MNITPDTPRKNIQIGGVILSAPTPYKEGHVLTANEAAALNQTFLENVGNNFRGKVTSTKRSILAGPNASPEALKAVTDAQLKDFDEKLESNQGLVNVPELQTSLDTLVAGYEMGVRRSSSVEVLDPVTKAARAIAKGKLTDSLKKKGIKLNTVKAEWWTREIDRLLNKESPVVKGDNNITEGIWKTAERQVNLLQAAAKDGLDDLDLTDMTKTETKGEVKFGSTGEDNTVVTEGQGSEAASAEDTPKGRKGK